MRQKTQTRRREQQSRKWIVPGASRTSPSPSHPIRVLIADGCEVIRVGLRSLLEGEHDLEVVGEADNVESVLSESRRIKPDIVLLGAWLSAGSEFDVYKTLLHMLPSARIISLMREDDGKMFRNAIEAGVQGYLRENAGRIELVRAIRAVAKGNSYLGQDVADQTVRLLRAREDAVCSRSALHILSSQERRVIAFIAEGNTNKEIAAKMVLSDKTVKNYIANMFAKLAVERRTQAAALYMKAQQGQSFISQETSV